MDRLTSTPWQVDLCLRLGFAFQRGANGDYLFSPGFYAHIHRVKPETVLKWMREKSGKLKKFAEPMMREADFEEMFEWVNGES